MFCVCRLYPLVALEPASARRNGPYTPLLHPPFVPFPFLLSFVSHLPQKRFPFSHSYVIRNP